MSPTSSPQTDDASRSSSRPGGAAARPDALGHVLFACTTAAWGFAGRATSVDGATSSLVWPAAGVGALWLLWALARDRAATVAATILLAVVLAVVGLTTSEQPRAIVVDVVVGVAQTLAAALLLRRGPAQPEDDTAQPELIRGFAGLVVAAAVSAGAAILGGVGIAVAIGADELGTDTVVLWWGSNVIGIVVVVTLTHLAREHLRERQRRPPRPVVAHPPVTRVLETTALVGLTAVCLATVFVDGGRTFAPLLALTTWAALRCSPLATAVYVSTLGAATVLVTLAGRGPFAEPGSAASRAADVQLLLAVTFGLGMLLSCSLADQRRLVARATTAERAARFQADLYTAVAEAMEEGVVVVDADGEVVMANSSAQQLIDAIPGRVARHGDAQLLHPDGSPVEASEYPSARAMRDGSSPPCDLVVHEKGRRTRVLSVAATRLTDVVESGDGAVVVYRDVTADRGRRDELAEYASTVAHDLATPLSAVRVLLELGVMEAESLQVDATVTHILQRAHAAAVRASALLLDMHEHATDGEETLRLDDVDLGRVVTDVVALHGAGGLVTAGHLPTARADELLVRQVLANLVGNATKYVAPGVEPQVRVDGRVVGDEVEVSVTDNGLGVPADQRTAIFDRLHRAHVERDDIAGTGLGLALCRTIVERHGTRIGVEPGPHGVGSRFWFTLPAAVPATPVSDDDPRADADADVMTV